MLDAKFTTEHPIRQQKRNHNFLYSSHHLELWNYPIHQEPCFSYFTQHLYIKNHRQLSWCVKAVQHIFHWGCLAAGCRACGGNKTKNLHWSACWWTWPRAQSSSACETRLKAQGPRAPGKTSGCLTFPSLKLGWRPRAFGDRVCGSKAHVPAFLRV